MKNLTKKLLSLILVLSLAAATMVPAFAYKANTGEIVGFKANFWSANPYWLCSLTIDISNIYTGFAGENSLQYSMSDVKISSESNQGNIFSLNNSNSSAKLIDNEDNVLRLKISFEKVFVMRFDKKTTFVIKEGAFTTADGKLSPEMTVSFKMNEFSTFQDRIGKEFGDSFLVFYWFGLPLILVGLPMAILNLFTFWWPSNQ